MCMHVNVNVNVCTSRFFNFLSMAVDSLLAEKSAAQISIVASLHALLDIVREPAHKVLEYQMASQWHETLMSCVQNLESSFNVQQNQDSPLSCLQMIKLIQRLVVPSDLAPLDSWKGASGLLEGLFSILVKGVGEEQREGFSLEKAHFDFLLEVLFIILSGNSEKCATNLW